MEGIILGIIFLAIYIGFSYGLFLINKKLGEKNAWLSFVPIIQYWSIAKASGKSFVWYILMPIIIIILLGFSLVPAAFSSPTLSMILGILLIVAYIYSFVAYIMVLHGISKRTGYGALMTVGNLFIPFILFPIIGAKMQDKSQGKQEQNQETENGTPDEL